MVVENIKHTVWKNEFMKQKVRENFGTQGLRKYIKSKWI